MRLYDFKTNDSKWQKVWEEEKVYKTKSTPGEKKVYVLDMFPYPSGEGLHVGHPKGYIATDIYSRFKRMNGYDVLHPMGWDAFGLPAEQFALKNKIHPKVAVEQNIANFKQQLSHLGLDYDWSREINTTDPSFYKWTQWIFTKLYEKGLAYESHEPINWCPSCKTGLANEDVNHDGTCERCDTAVEKKPIRQWVLKITEYADRMLNDLETLQWPEGVKTAQKNWIGRSEGASFTFPVITDGQKGLPDSVEIFTTRADTMFGATFVAISPELASLWVKDGFAVSDEIKNYIINTLTEQQKETDYSVVKEKTGIFTGVYAINPTTKEKLPIWIANYVLGGVGTGAIMAVPAHDERDFDFAKKYNLPIKQVVVPPYIQTTEPGKFREDKETIVRDGTITIVKHWSEEKYIAMKWKKVAWVTLQTGTVDEGMTAEETAIKEAKEETGYTDIKSIKKLGVVDGIFFHVPKDINKHVHGHIFYIELANDTCEEISQVENDLHDILWLTIDELKRSLTADTHRYAIEVFQNGYKPYVKEGSVTDSGSYTGLHSGIAREKIIADFGGTKVVKYKIQDWVFARQRYWGEPFPVVRDENGKVYMVDESELPVLLPEVESYEPTGTGESPLAVITDWVNVQGYITEKGTFKQSHDGKVFTRETNTMPQWAGSSWYYLRFIDPHNDKALIDPTLEKAWQPVDVYVGGDHATRHLIYARFWHKFLYDIGVVSTIEPFSRLEFLGFILAEDGRKMSKRWGNVINPDDVIHEYGADTLRVYEMFMAPFEQTASWSTSSIKGSDKFLDRVYALQKNISEKSTITHELHKTIKKVTEDIESFKFNTAVSQMMILVNEMERGSFTKNDYTILLQVLAPFAPHITEQVWHELGATSLIHTSSWPKYEEQYLKTSDVTLAIQVAGKLRGTIVLPRDLEEREVIAQVKNHSVYQKYVENKEPKKIVVIPNRLVNIVI